MSVHLGGPSLQVMGQLGWAVVPILGVVGITDSRGGELGFGLRGLVAHGEGTTLGLLIQLGRGGGRVEKGLGVKGEGGERRVRDGTSMRECVMWRIQMMMQKWQGGPLAEVGWSVLLTMLSVQLIKHTWMLVCCMNA